jgi:hypothetical protein
VIRLALLLWYLTATLAGSRPCCCAAPSTELARRPSEGQAADAKPAPTKRACPLCAAEKKPQPPKPDTPTPVKKQNCPCPKAVLTAPAVMPAADDRQVASTAGIPAEHVPLTLLVRAVQVVHAGPPPDPSSHLLKLCHRLRC